MEQQRNAYFFICYACNYKEFMGYVHDMEEKDIYDFIEKEITSTGCHSGCGEKRWCVRDTNRTELIE